MAMGQEIHTDDFRDTLSTSSRNGGRIRIYPKIFIGNLYRWRRIVAYILIAALFTGPFVEINHNPLFLFNVFERKFVFFAIPFWPQDFYILAIGLLTFMVFIVLFTVVFGRVWCGWACPQTIFMEMVFRRIETWLEGDFRQQKLFDEKPYDADKIFRKSIKHMLFFGISFVIANVFLTYLIGKQSLWLLISDGPLVYKAVFFSLLIFTGVFYFVFAKFRELVCIIVCPYGRLQGVLLDKKSIVVAYDHLRGEPRGKISKIDATLSKGDCVDCKLCIHVCPTGIDIRNGTQLECINCTACIDVCNSVMDNIGSAHGLIRYDSLEGIEQKKKLQFNTRIMAYSLFLAMLAGFFAYLIFSRKPVETTILRTPGTLYQQASDGRISNLYNYEVLNKTAENMPIKFTVLNLDANIRLIGNDYVDADAETITKGSFFIEIAPEAILSNKTTLKIGVISNDKLVETIQSNFYGKR